MCKAVKYTQHGDLKPYTIRYFNAKGTGVAVPVGTTALSTEHRSFCDV